MSKTLIKLTDIDKSFGAASVLRKVSLQLDEGEIHCLAGENRSGKSTLIKIISGVYRHDAGRIELGGRHYPTLRPIDAIREGVQVIYQDFSLFPNLTVAENLALSDQVESGRAWVSWQRVEAIARESLALIGVDMDTSRLVEELPVSGKQLVAIARAVYCNARVIIMDEPTTTLTDREIASLFALIRRLKERGIATLFVSHKMREMLDITERITILRNGEKVAEGRTEDFDEAGITRAMTGRDIRSDRYVWNGVRSDPVLELRDFTRTGDFQGLNLSLYKGEIVGITGLLGSGRTELAETLFGLRNTRERPGGEKNSGKILRNGREIKVRSVSDAIAEGIAYVPEDRLTEGIFAEQPIERNLFANSYPRFKNALGLLDRAKLRELSSALIRAYNVVASNLKLPIRTLSGGNQQKVMLARWISTGAEVLLLNGPTVGVDVGARFEIYRKLREIAAGGVGILLFSDELQELISNCNRIFVINRGRFTHELDTGALQEDELSALLGLSLEEAIQ